ncbi:MAG TPA: UbiD family decarboxylase, partial [Candidatus Eisenbacteria bacterium]|nr:UbiD family decarboxylase [Candidatus Eisenbacteria bacterium]
MPRDLRSFLVDLETRAPAQFVRIQKPVAARYEISAILTHLERRKRFPVLFFQNVDSGRAPVVINVQASRDLMALALDCRPRDLAREFGERQARPISPIEIRVAPSQEVVKLGDEADLTQIPMLTHYDVNAAPYLTAGIVIAADPETRARNTSYNRLMLAGKRELRIFMAIGRHLWTLHNKMERLNEPLPVAVVIGVHPLFSLGAQAFTPAVEDEYAVIGGMMR